MGVLVAAGLIPLATAENNGLMPKGLCSYSKLIASKGNFIEILKLKYDGIAKYIDCFIGISKNHEDVFVLCALHLYAFKSAQNAFIKVLVEKKILGYNFYILKEDKSISIFLQNNNSYSFVFLTPIYPCSFHDPEFKELDSLPEGAELMQIAK